MKSGNIARYLLIVTLGLSACSSVAFGQTSSNRWSGNGPYGGAIRWFAIAQAIQAATRASVTEPTGQAVLRAVANGRIAFVSSFVGSSDIYTMNPDGSDRKQLTFSNQDLESDPVWSSDGTKIAFARCNINSRFGEIFVMNADGSDQRRLTQSAGYDLSPTWSPDGTKIAFWRRAGPTTGHSDRIFVM